MRIYKLTKLNLPKIAVLATGLAAAALLATVSPQAAHATPQATTTGIHGPYSINSAQCGTCHRAHTAKAPNLLKSRSPGSLGSQSTLCLGCHDGTGADPAVKVQYDLVRPVNNAPAREYFSHDAVDATPVTVHTQSGLNEFGGAVNRHSECADCHNSHQATATAARDSAQTAGGWDASRRLAGVSGVSVLNGVAGAAPAYTFLSGSMDSVTDPITLEYQLCFKCHSGFTKLPSPITDKPSKDSLDKGVEFNPENPSFHPVEAAGKNTTPAMAASLAGASTYKLWDFQITSTIRCLNCHASSATPGTAPLPQPGSALAPHTSSTRGILIRNYQDRVLKPMSGTDAAYSAGDFALCYVCHGQAPFAPGASSDPEAALQTNFSYHSKHVSGLAGEGSVGTDIDTAGDGGGNAICAECHFRLHSTTNKVGAQTLTGDPVTGSRLVNFAPNVTANGVGAPISWTSTGTGAGSCTLTCHGKKHTGYEYGP